MPAQTSELDYLIASGAAALAATEATRVPLAVRAELNLAEYVDILRWQLAATLGFRPSRANIVRLLAACETWPAELDVSWDLDFGSASDASVWGWAAAPDGPQRPTITGSGLDGGSPDHINLDYTVPMLSRSGAGIGGTPTIKVYRVDGGRLVYVKDGNINPNGGGSVQIGPTHLGIIPHGAPVTLTLKTEAQAPVGQNGDMWSYPTPFVTLTPA